MDYAIVWHYAQVNHGSAASLKFCHPHIKLSGAPWSKWRTEFIECVSSNLFRDAYAFIFGTYDTFTEVVLREICFSVDIFLTFCQPFDRKQQIFYFLHELYKILYPNAIVVLTLRSRTWSGLINCCLPLLCVHCHSYEGTGMLKL